MLTLKEAQKLAAELVKEYAAWQREDVELIQWRGEAYRRISEPLFRLIATACDKVTGSIEVEPEARTIAMAFDGLAVAFSRWRQRAVNDDAEPNGGPTVTEQINRVELALAKSRTSYKLPPSIEYLRKLNVSYQQIASAYYGWRDALGHPDVQKVVEEELKPGTHFNAKTYKAPAQIADERERDEQWAKHRRPTFRLTEPSEPKAEKRPVSEFIEVGALPEQIMNYYGITIDEVWQLYRDAGKAPVGRIVPELVKA